MSYKDDIRQGEFRGVKFFTTTSTHTIGRRINQHEFPNRDKPFTEDLGRIADNFELEGHVVGQDYFKVRNELKRVFTQKGPAELIHPFWGAVFVQVGSVSITESTLEGAIAKFSAKFFEAGDNRFPKGSNDKGAILDESIDIAVAAAKTDFEEKFSVAGLPAFAVDSARNGIASITDTFNDVTKVAGTVADGVTDLAFATRNLLAEVDDLLNAPGELADRLIGSFDLLLAIFIEPEKQAVAYSNFYDSGDSDVTGDTPIRNQERQNQDALNNFMRRVSTSKGAGSATNGDYASFSDAENARIEITDAIELQLREDDGTEVFQSLADVNANLVEALPDVDADLPSLKTITTIETTNTLVISYDLFESIENEQDLIDRNNIENPAHIELGTELEVLDV